MLFDLFSSFDYSVGIIGSSVMWFAGLSWFFYYLMSYFWSSSIFSVVKNFLVNLFLVQTKILVYKYMKGSSFVKFFCFFVFLGTKFWGLVPYVFSKTSHLTFVCIFSLLVWTCMMFSHLAYNVYKVVYSFFPYSPGFLLPLLSLVELMSLIMRPMTLSLRLSMNMTTGHVFMGIISSSFVKILMCWKMSLSVFVLFLLIGYFLFESCMCFVQAFVYSLLCSSYMEEHFLKH